jgi:hypothetical protein
MVLRLCTIGVGEQPHDAYNALAELNGEDDDGDACPFAVCLLKGFGEELFYCV